MRTGQCHHERKTFGRNTHAKLHFHRATIFTVTQVKHTVWSVGDAEDEAGLQYSGGLTQKVSSLRQTNANHNIIKNYILHAVKFPDFLLECVTLFSPMLLT